jgi:taurine dioxygenase
MVSRSMKVSRLAAALGVAIEGIHLADVDDDTLAEIKRLLFGNCVVVVRNSRLDPESHVAFGKRWGPLTMTRGTEDLAGKKQPMEPLAGHPEILRLFNLGKPRTLTEVWHADNCHVQRPTAVGILSAQRLPAVGGDTMFSSQYLAYENLSAPMKRILRGKRLEHTGETNPGFLEGKQEIPRFYHPIVRSHPDTGRRAIFIGGRPSPAHQGIEGMTLSESNALHQFLFDHSLQPHFCYRHQWREGDVLLWDNRCAMHYAVHDYGDEPREMHRVTIEGEVPFEAPYDD